MLGLITDYKQKLDSLNRQRADVEQKLREVQAALEGYQKRLDEVELEIQKVNSQIIQELRNGG